MPDLTKMSVQSLCDEYRNAVLTESRMGVSTWGLQEAILAELTRRTEVPSGHVKLDDGRVVKVLGTLPMTADGFVIGDGAYLWNILPGWKGRDDDRPMRIAYRMCPVTDPDAYGGKRVMYSTREAALAAKGVER